MSFFSKLFCKGTQFKIKTFNNTDINGAHKQVPDIEVFGNGDYWQLICKATKAIDIPGYGCLVQVTTQQLSPNGQYAVAESVVAVPGVKVCQNS